MDSLHIDTGEKRIQIDDDPGRMIVFNPSDVLWVDRFRGMKRDVLAKLDEFSKKSGELQVIIRFEAKKKAPDQNLIDETENRGSALYREACIYMRGLIDNIFGKDASQTAFGDLMSGTAIVSFLEGITPYIEIVRAAKVAAYVPHPQAKKRKSKAVMK
jgi:hypothetical protein